MPHTSSQGSVVGQPWPPPYPGDSQHRVQAGAGSAVPVVTMPLPPRRRGALPSSHGPHLPAAPQAFLRWPSFRKVPTAGREAEAVQDPAESLHQQSCCREQQGGCCWRQPRKAPRWHRAVTASTLWEGD